MINAEFLKLRKRRGLFWLSLFLIAGGVVLFNVLVSAYHLSDPAKYAPAGGIAGMSHSEILFGLTVALAAVLIGATAGSQDVESGVFRSLAATGQSRLKMALVRIPAALMMLLPMVLVGYALEVAAVFVLAGGTATPDATMLLVLLGWVAVMGALNVTVSLGVAALLGSRAFAIGLLVAWQLAGARIIDRITALGDWRALTPTISTDRLLPGSTDAITLSPVDTVTVSLAAAAVVIVAWMVVATALGAWRTATQEA